MWSTLSSEQGWSLILILILLFGQLISAFSGYCKFRVICHFFTARYYRIRAAHFKSLVRSYGCSGNKVCILLAFVKYLTQSNLFFKKFDQMAINLAKIILPQRTSLNMAKFQSLSFLEFLIKSYTSWKISIVFYYFQSLWRHKRQAIDIWALKIHMCALFIKLLNLSKFH